MQGEEQAVSQTAKKTFVTEISDVELIASAQAAKWDRVKRRLRVELGEDVFSSWFGRVEYEQLVDGVLVLSVPTRFLKSWLQIHFNERLLLASQAEFSATERIELVVRGPGKPRVAIAPGSQTGYGAAQPQPRPAPSQPSGPQGASQTAPQGQALARPAVDRSAERGTNAGAASETGGAFDGSPLDRRYTFDNFVVGASNQMAYAASKALAENLLVRPIEFNPLYLQSGVGLGKTHLLNAIAWEARARHPQARVLYLTAERFMYSFAEALKAKDALTFKDRLRAIDLLLIDDMEYLHGDRTQEEFGHTINALIDSGKQVVVASVRGPNQLESLDARLRSRLSGGFVAEIQPLDFDLRASILRKRAAEAARADAGFTVDESVITFLAEKLTDSGRELEGAITRLQATHRFMREPITVDSAEHIIRDLMRGKEPRRVKIDDILRVVCKHYGIPRTDILSERRNRSIVWPRQIGMYLAKLLTARSLPEIGRRFGGRDHTTVLHAIRKIESQLADNGQLRDEIEVLKRLLKDS